MKFCSQELDLQEASEPTDIIWENRHFSPHQRNMKRIVVYIVIIFMLTISGAIIFACTNISLSLKFKYPKADCASVKKEYSTRADPMTW